MLIGFTGRAGVGKTTLAKMLEEREGFVIRTYAYPLKKSLTTLTGLPMDFFTDINLKEKPLDFGKSPRQLMQLMGTEFVREMIDPDFWVWRMKQVLLSMDDGIRVVVDDCRFENETALIRELGGTVIHLDRYYGAVTTHQEHRSEQPLRILSGDVRIQSFGYSEEYAYEKVLEVLHAPVSG